MKDWMVHTAANGQEVIYRPHDVKLINSRTSSENPNIKDVEIHFGTNFFIIQSMSIEEYCRFKRDIMMKGNNDKNN